jgi:hypothetical protein
MAFKALPQRCKPGSCHHWRLEISWSLNARGDRRSCGAASMAGRSRLGLTATTIRYRPIAVAQCISRTMLTPVPEIAPSGPAEACAVCGWRDHESLRRGWPSRKSATTTRPPGASTRTISAPARPGSAKWRSAVVHSTADRLPVENGRWRASATTNSAGRPRASTCACSIMAEEASTPMANATVVDASRTADPVAQPISRNRSWGARHSRSAARMRKSRRSWEKTSPFS